MRLIRISVSRVMSSSVTAPAQRFQERLQAFANFLEHALPRLRFLDPPVDPLLDEDALERIPVPLLLEFAQLDLELALQQRLRLVRARASGSRARRGNAACRRRLDRTITHAGDEIRLAAREHVELLNHLLRIAALRQMDEDLDFVRRVVVDVLDLDLALRVRREDRLDQRFGR